MKKNKSYVVLQQTTPQRFLPRTAEDGSMTVVANYRARWKLMNGFDFVKTFFPRTKNWDFEVHMLSNNQVKALLQHAKKYPKFLEIAFLPAEISPISDDTTNGDTTETQLPEDNQSGNSDATSGGNTQPQ